MINKQKFMGIRSDEILDCGCILKRYISGLNVIDPENVAIDCENSTHRRFKEYECRACGFKTNSKREMRKHRWGHAI